jgi:hypothetical protein
MVNKQQQYDCEKIVTYSPRLVKPTFSLKGSSQIHGPRPNAALRKKDESFGAVLHLTS